MKLNLRFFFLLEDIIADVNRIAVTTGTPARDRRHNASRFESWFCASTAF